MTDEDGKQGAWLRLHRLWALTIVMAVVLAVAGVTPAGAQSTEMVGVSNLEAAGNQPNLTGRGPAIRTVILHRPLRCCSHQGSLGHEKHQRSQSGAIGDHTR